MAKRLVLRVGDVFIVSVSIDPQSGLGTDENISRLVVALSIHIKCSP